MHLLVIVIFLFGCSACCGLKSDVLYRPNGDYPSFYDEGPYNHVSPGLRYRVRTVVNVQVINIDEETFNATVFNNHLPIVVEIYRDWFAFTQ